MSQEIKLEHKTYKHRRSIFFPLLLVVIGIVLLLNTLHIIEGASWEVVIRLWPILLIIGGLDSLFQREGYVSSVLGIGLGFLFLAYYFNYLRPWDIHLWDILRLWPILLLAWGFDILVGRRTIWSMALGVVIGLGLLAGLFWLLTNPMSVSGRTEITQIEQTVGEEETVEVDLSMVSAKLNLSDGSDESMLITGQAKMLQNVNIEPSYSLQGSKGIFRLNGENIEGIFLSGNASKVDLELNPSIPLTLYTEVNAGEQDVDLSELKVERFTLDQSVGQVVLTLPEEEGYHGSVNLPVGELVIKVPEDSEVRIAFSKGLTVLSYPSDYTRRGDVISSPGVDDEGDNVATLQVSVPLGVLEIVEVP